MARPAVRASAPEIPAVPPPQVREHVIVVSLIVALLGTAWLVDPFAQAVFDAPKRLVALIAAAVAGAALLARLSHPPSTAAADRLALTRAAPSCRLDVVSATPSPSLSPRRASERRLDGLATNGGEKGGLADFGVVRSLLRRDGALAPAAGLARLALLAGLAALAGLLLATLLAPQPPASAATLRLQLLFALFLPLGASRVLDGAGGRRVLIAALLAAAVNALLSLLQWAGLDLPFVAAQNGGRYPTGALLGNEAFVALGAALMAAAGVALGLSSAVARRRWAGWALLALGIAVMLANRQRASLIAVFAATAVLVSLRWRATRWMPVTGAALTLLLGLCAALPALRAQTWARLPVSVETWQTLTTYRLGAWAAALEMVATRPWTGYGPGSYANQSQVQRFAAEIGLRRRLPPPQPATTFVQAHQDYLQVAAEAGLPVLAALLAALGALFIGLLRLAQRVAADRATLEARLLLGVIVAGAVAALTWFPLQIPFTAIVLLLACGRAWRLLALQGEDSR